MDGTTTTVQQPERPSCREKKETKIDVWIGGSEVVNFDNSPVICEPDDIDMPIVNDDDLEIISTWNIEPSHPLFLF